MRRALQTGIIVLGVLLLAVGTAWCQTGAASVVTDKSDYSPGGIVTITGSGWQPGETVTLQFVESPLIDTHPDLTAVADANGNIFNNQFSPDFLDVNVIFTLTATGNLSGLQAQTMFTDSRTVTAVTLNGSSSVTVAPGATISASVTVNLSTGFGTDTWQSTGWRISTTAPGTVTCVDTPDHSVGLFGNQNFTETFNITAPSTPGTYNAYFIAYTNDTCSSGASGTFTMTSAVTVAQPPTITKAFAPTTIAVGGTSTLTLTITNPFSTFTQTGVAVSDTFPAGVQVAATPNLTNTCSGGTVTGATSGSGTISLSGASIPASSSCAVSVSVTGTTGGAKANTTGNVSSTNGGTGGTASATLTVVAPPTITKAFGSSATGIPVNGTSTMTITITNPAANTVAESGVAVSDTFPAGMTISTALTTTCSGGTLTGNGVGSNSFSLGGASIPTGGNCTITGSVTDNTAGVATNTTGAVTSTNGGTGSTATATLPVEVAPTITKSFNPTSIAVNGTSTMTIAIVNPAGNTVSLTGVTLSDTFPSTNMKVATPSGAGTSGCGGGTFTATAGSSTVSLANGTIAAGGTCTLTANVTATANGSYVNTTGNVSSTNGGTDGSATATLTVTAPPTITKSFNPTTIPLNGTSTLTLTITNPAANSGAMNGIAVTDAFPSGMAVTSSPVIGNTCGGTFAPAGGATSISLTGGSIATPGNTCAVSVSVTSTTAGSRSNTTGNVSSTNDGTGGTANATLTVVAPPSITKAFGSSATGIPVNGTSTMTITITNPAANTVAETGVTVSDTFPAGMSISTALTTTCSGGTLTGNGIGSNSFSLNGASIPTSGNCTITGSVTDNTAGAAINTTGNVSSTNGGTGGTATATLPVELPPTVTKTFAPASIAPGGTSTLTLTFTNPTGNTVTLTGLAISDTYPAGLVNANTPNRTNTCGGTSTGSAGGSTLALTTGNSVAAGGSCTLSITVTAAAGGSYVNTTGNVSSTNGGSDGPATATLAVNLAPTITKGFNPTSIPVNGTSTLTLTITNPATNTVALTGVAVSDTLPSGVVVATPNGASSTCGGTFTATAGAGSISLTGGTVAAGSSCTLIANVKATTAGNKNNTTGNVSATNGGTGGTASATLTVVAPPTITKAFNPTTTQVNGTSTLTLTITNPAANTVAQAGVAVTDAFPANLQVASTPSATNTCGGAFTASAGTGSISLTGGTVGVNTSCAVSVSVTPLTTGTFPNTTGSVSSTNGGTGGTASATLTVFGLPTQLVFGTQPSNTTAGSAITPAVTVQVEDASGNVVINGTGSTAAVTMAIGTNPSAGVLSGTTTVNAVAGIATFSTLSVSAEGIGYTLTATSDVLTATSNAFNITAPQVTYTQPFNSGHGWTYTQTGCSVGGIGVCSNSAAATGANCASTPCVDSSALAVLQPGDQTGYFQSPTGSYTWQTLGVPANAAVTSVQGGWSDRATGCNTGTSAGIQIYDSTNSTEITSPSVVGLTEVSGDTSVTVHNLGGVATVNPGFNASSTGVTLRFNLNDAFTSTLFGLCTLYGDTFKLLISYIPGGSTSTPGRKGQVVIGWNITPQGTVGNTWAQRATE